MGVTEETTPETETKEESTEEKRRGRRIKNQYAYNSKQPNPKSRGVCILCKTTNNKVIPQTAQSKTRGQKLQPTSKGKKWKKLKFILTYKSHYCNTCNTSL